MIDDLYFLINNFNHHFNFNLLHLNFINPYLKYFLNNFTNLFLFIFVIIKFYLGF